MGRTQASATCRSKDMLDLGVTGPMLRGRRAGGSTRGNRSRYRATTSSTLGPHPAEKRRFFGPLSGPRGTEMRQSARIVRAGAGRNAGRTAHSGRAKVVLPEREEKIEDPSGVADLYFKIVTEGFRVPEGEVVPGDRIASAASWGTTWLAMGHRSRTGCIFTDRASAICRGCPR